MANSAGWKERVEGKRKHHDKQRDVFETKGECIKERGVSQPVCITRLSNWSFNLTTALLIYLSCSRSERSKNTRADAITNYKVSDKDL